MSSDAQRADSFYQFLTPAVDLQPPPPRRHTHSLLLGILFPIPQEQHFRRHFRCSSRGEAWKLHFADRNSSVTGNFQWDPSHDHPSHDRDEDHHQTTALHPKGD